MPLRFLPFLLSAALVGCGDSTSDGAEGAGAAGASATQGLPVCDYLTLGEAQTHMPGFVAATPQSPQECAYEVPGTLSRVDFTVALGSSALELQGRYPQVTDWTMDFDVPFGLSAELPSADASYGSIFIVAETAKGAMGLKLTAGPSLVRGFGVGMSKTIISRLQ